MSDPWWAYGVVAVAAAATYFWRGLGVALAARVKTDSLVFTWIGCVAYALLAGLIARMILLPEGPVAGAPLHARLGGVAAAIGVFVLTRRNMLLAVLAGGAAMVALGFDGLSG